MSEHAGTRKHISEHSWSSVWVILSILAHLAHLAQSYFSLIFSAINTYNSSWFDQTNKKKLQWQKTKTWWKVTSSYDFFPHGDSRHYWYPQEKTYTDEWNDKRKLICQRERNNEVQIIHFLAVMLKKTRKLMDWPT